MAIGMEYEISDGVSSWYRIKTQFLVLLPSLCPDVIPVKALPITEPIYSYMIDFNPFNSLFTI